MNVLRWMLAACALWAAGQAWASQFYVFGVPELEGVNPKIPAEKRPLIDLRVRDIFTPELQMEMLGALQQELRSAFPDSAVHPRQVTDVLRGKYQYLDAPVCKEGFSVPLRSSFAVVLGLTRGSWYAVERQGGRVELLVPVTVNLQVVKPELAKVVYSISETLYSPFLFAKEEMDTPAQQARVREVVASGVRRQVGELVRALKQNFNPKETPVRIVGRSQGVLVVDQGFEIGFKVDDEPEATHRASGKTALFKVLSVGSGHAVLKLLDGDASPGDEFIFTFGTAADDSRKPRVMPVTSLKPGKTWTHAVVDLFTKNIGFKAGFQLAPVDENFADTMQFVRAGASCAPWEKYPSAQQIFESRQDVPDYFLEFALSRSPVAFQSGQGGVKTVESFITAVTAQVVDARGHVIFSETGSDAYRLEKTAGQGLSLGSALEVSLKNATEALARRFIENVKFEPAEFKVGSVGQGRIVVPGLVVPEGAEVAYEVMRPLDVKVGGRPVMWQLALGEGNQPPSSDGQSTTISYSKLDVDPRPGDIVRVLNLPRKGQSRLAACTDVFRGTGSAPADFLLPLVRNAAYRSLRHQVLLTDPEFYADANHLLEAGFFKKRMEPPAPADTCMKPGYLVKQESLKCEAGTCAGQILSATTVIVEKGGTRLANFVQAEKVTYDGFPETQAENFLGFKAFENTLRSLGKLTDKLNATK